MDNVLEVAPCDECQKENRVVDLRAATRYEKHEGAMINVLYRVCQKCFDNDNKPKEVV